MEILPGSHLLRSWKEKDVQAMQHVALNFWQLDRLRFKIFKVTGSEVIFGVTQAKLSSEEKYYTQKQLIELVHKLFDRYFPNHKVNVQASPYEESPALKVTSEWIKKKMEEHGVTLKDMAAETGLNNTQLSPLTTGTKPLSDAMKAMFYFYFRSKEVKE